ncbi:MAG: NTP transferase domain-containing protein [Gammaproteobacteria bacterium]|nr:NTP transferase domain-containing protein [Gammaproteobacteria bacterium]
MIPTRASARLCHSVIPAKAGIQLFFASALVRHSGESRNPVAVAPLFSLLRHKATKVQNLVKMDSGFRRNDDVRELPTASDLTLGILAGGRATRLGGVDKAWLERDGVPQVLRLARRFAPEVGSVLVSANRGIARYAEQDLPVVADRRSGTGPLGGVDALAQACGTLWLLTLPVDLVAVSDCLLPALIAGAAADGAFAEDDDGPQPLVALWRIEALRDGLATTAGSSNLAVHALQARLDMACVRFAGVRFGNINTPADLAAAGFPDHDGR